MVVGRLLGCYPGTSQLLPHGGHVDHVVLCEGVYGSMGGNQCQKYLFLVGVQSYF